MKVNLNDIEMLLEHPTYKVYLKEKMKIKERYPKELFKHYAKDDKISKAIKYKEGEQELFREYMREIAELILKPSGTFQEFLWETLSERDKEVRDRTARGRFGRQIEY